jgi:hypothetical protein
MSCLLVSILSPDRGEVRPGGAEFLLRSGFYFNPLTPAGRVETHIVQIQLPQVKKFQSAPFSEGR